MGIAAEGGNEGLGTACAFQGGTDTEPLVGQDYEARARRLGSVTPGKECGPLEPPETPHWLLEVPTRPQLKCCVDCGARARLRRGRLSRLSS